MVTNNQGGRGIDPTRFIELLSRFQLNRLFVELGWDHATMSPQRVQVGEESFELTAIVEKRGVVIFQCGSDAEGKIPERKVQLKIETEVARIAYEHLLIFTDSEEETLTWLWVSRVPGQPIATRTHTWRKGESGEPLRQKLESIVWSLEDEEAITLADVITGMKGAFDRNSISKYFYDLFKAKHAQFSEFIEGLDNVVDKDWYASLMLNRLMFIYFIQRKGFLNGNGNYLKDKLRQVQEESGKGHFHSFYRVFLKRLFHEGLGTPADQRGADFDRLLGEIPYLNGGLFDLHELEENNPGIDVSDEAFERLFDFFDAYDWHLDDRPLKNDKEINPDVLGYIFEKYVNQKQMGAYYTKEDITEYISKNTVIPYLLEVVWEHCSVAFSGDEEDVWNLLEEDPDRYIYPAMKKGIIGGDGEIVPFDNALAEDDESSVEGTIKDFVFHVADGERGTLPTETLREYIYRRRTCLELRRMLADGEVKTIENLVSLNLDIRQFMQDIISTSSGPQLLRAVWHAIAGRESGHSPRGITVLDPTCGSGAFLFAALNILKPLYEACLDRMEGFREDALKLGNQPEKDFDRILAEIASHPSRSYFVYKSIILNNLFGVDIMAEAVEICKLRLFLKLVSQVDRVHDLEPLPDIDFNIRVGNALVGFATEAQFDESGDLASDESRREEIKMGMVDLAESFDRFRERQTHQDEEERGNKKMLQQELDCLSSGLDKYLANDYGIDLSETDALDEWRESHKSFHWLAEFHGVMQGGGFDVVIGNPPYIRTSKIREEYTVLNFDTKSCPDVYAWCLERVLSVSNDHAWTGMIVPLSLSFDKKFSAVRDAYGDSTSWFSHFGRIPSALFSADVRLPNTIHIAALHRGVGDQFTTRFHRWNAEARPHLFPTLYYSRCTLPLWKNRIPKLQDGLIHIFEKNLSISGDNFAGASTSASPTQYVLYFKTLAYNWLAFSYVEPPCYDMENNPIPQPAIGQIFFPSEDERDLNFLILNSKLMYAFWVAVGDSFHVTKWTISNLPICTKGFPEDVRKKLLILAPNLNSAMESALQYKVNAGKRSGNYNLAKCRHVTDEVDKILLEHLGLASLWGDLQLFYDQTVKTDFEEGVEGA